MELLRHCLIKEDHCLLQCPTPLHLAWLNPKEHPSWLISGNFGNSFLNVLLWDSIQFLPLGPNKCFCHCSSGRGPLFCFSSFSRDLTNLCSIHTGMQRVQICYCQALTHLFISILYFHLKFFLFTMIFSFCLLLMIFNFRSSAFIFKFFFKIWPLSIVLWQLIFDITFTFDLTFDRWPLAFDLWLLTF